MNISIIIMIVVLAACTQQSFALNYTVCDTSKLLADLKEAKVSDCDSPHDVCTFTRGFNKTIELDFVPKQKIDQVKVKVAGRVSKLPLPFAINPDAACGNYGFDCPLEADKPYKFKLSMPILRTYPRLNVGVFVRLVNEKDDVIVCVELPASIQEPKKVRR